MVKFLFFLLLAFLLAARGFPRLPLFHPFDFDFDFYLDLDLTLNLNLNLGGSPPRDFKESAGGLPHQCGHRLGRHFRFLGLRFPIALIKR